MILSADPTAVDPETLDSIDVLETIKCGETVFERDAGSAATSPDRAPNPAVAPLLAAIGGHDAACPSPGPAHEAYSAQHRFVSPTAY